MSLLAQHASAVLSSPPSASRDAGQRALPEGPPDHRRVRDAARAQTARASRAARPAAPARSSGSSAAPAPALLGQALHHLLGEQRIALGARRRARRAALLVCAAPRSRPLISSRVSSSPSGSRNRSSRRAATRPIRLGARSSSSRAEQTCSTGARSHCDEILDQIEHSLVRPVDVLPHEHQRLARARAPRRTTRTAAKKLSRALWRPAARARRRRVRRLDPEQARDRRDAALAPARRRRLAAASSGAETRRQLLPRARRRVSVDDRALRAHHLAQRPVDDARAERQAAPAAQRAAACRARASSRSNSRSRRVLPTPGLADHRDQVRRRRFARRDR